MSVLRIAQMKVHLRLVAIQVSTVASLLKQRSEPDRQLEIKTKRFQSSYSIQKDAYQLPRWFEIVHQGFESL